MITVKPKFELDVKSWEIPLRYYHGWTIQFRVAGECFDCPILCLFGFSNVADIERAIDRAIQYRDKGN